MPSPLEHTAERETAFRERLARLQTLTAEERIAEQRQAAPRWSDEELGPWSDAKQRANMKIMNIFGTNQDWSALIAKIICPALLITADPAQGAIVTPDAAAIFQTLVPQVQIAQIADAGHNIRRDQFDAYIKVVEAYLDKR